MQLIHYKGINDCVHWKNCRRAANTYYKKYKQSWYDCRTLTDYILYNNLDDLSILAPARHKLKLFKPQTINCVHANFFSERVIKCWNSLPHTVDFSSFSKFKRTVISVKRVDFGFSQILMCIIY